MLSSVLISLNCSRELGAHMSAMIRTTKLDQESVDFVEVGVDGGRLGHQTGLDVGF